MSISTRDLTVLLGVIMIVFMLVIPLPAIMLDFLIIINILIALMVLLVAAYRRRQSYRKPR